MEVEMRMRGEMVDTQVRKMRMRMLKLCCLLFAAYVRVSGS